MEQILRLKFKDGEELCPLCKLEEGARLHRFGISDYICDTCSIKFNHNYLENILTIETK